MLDVITFPKEDGEETTPQISHQDIEDYIDRKMGREDPKLQQEVRRDMQKGYMRMGTRSNPKHECASKTEREGE